MQEKDLLQFHLPYGQIQITSKAKAEGYTDSDFSNVIVYDSHPHLAKVDNNTLRISNCRTAATSYEVYANGVLKDTVAYSGEDGGTLDVDISGYTYPEDGATYNVTVKGVGAGIAENESEAVSIGWKGNNVILGVSGLHQSAPELTRTDDAIGKTWTMNNNVISSDFDDLFPYNLMKRHTIDGDEFVFVPELYLRIGYNSDRCLADVAVAPLEMKAGGNQVVVHVDAFYYGAYGASVSNGKMYSKSNVARKDSVTCGNFRTYAKARGSKYRQLDLYHMRVLDFLWLIEFATKNSDTVMLGYKDSLGTCGATDSLTAPSGQLSEGGRMRWRYIEDFIGNGYEFFDGAYGLGATQDESKYGQTVTDVEYRQYSVNRYCLPALKFHPIYPLLAVPERYIDNEHYDTYFCDGVLCKPGDYVYYRGRCNSYADSGLFLWYCCTPTHTSFNISSRLLFIP